MPRHPPLGGPRRARAFPHLFVLAATALGITTAGCAGLPPGAHFPRVASRALVAPEDTRLGAQFATAAHEHGGASGFRLLNIGVDGFLARVQMIDAAQRTLDLQYFIFRGDQTGRTISAALQRAADRGVRIRVLVDDGDTLPGDEQLLALAGHPAMQIRVFNPFVYRGHASWVRGLEFLFNWRRLDYRMHNKLIVADNTLALIGGRNIGNQYFQMDPQSQFADDDVFVAGPIVHQLSASFDDFWNSPLSIPAQALGHGRRQPLDNHLIQALDYRGIDYLTLIRSNEPYAALISGRLPLAWANAQVVYDSPEKKAVRSGARRGRLMEPPVAQAVAEVREELLMTTPYFIPAHDEMQLMDALLQRGARLAILTNSLKSAPEVLPQAGYSGYRLSLLEDGADVYELRPQLGNQRGSGQTRHISNFGHYGLHAKLFVFDRRRLFVGSMNFDQRSKRLNTEIGLIIDSPLLAAQAATRFDAMTQPENAYALVLHTSPSGGEEQLAWDTIENGVQVEYTTEPARSPWQRLMMHLLSWLPDHSEL